MRFRNAGEFGQHFSKSTIGIVGMGNIGFEIAKRAHFGFGCNILYHNRKPRDTAALVNAKYYSTLNEMVPECDFICVVCNLSAETKDIISNDQFDLMKDTAILCNVSRGGTVNQDALYDALNTNSIFGAALDVTTPEPLPRDHKLLTCNNLIITPHWGTATKIAVMEMLGIAIDNINSALSNEKMVSELL